MIRNVTDGGGLWEPQVECTNVHAHRQTKESTNCSGQPNAGSRRRHAGSRRRQKKKKKKKKKKNKKKKKKNKK